jgi:hypothetical protein
MRTLSTRPEIPEPSRPRTTRPLEVTFWVFIGAYIFNTALELIYVVYAIGASTDISTYGYGHVPTERLRTFVSLSDALPTVTAVVGYASVVVFVVLVYQTAVVPSRLGTKFVLSPVMTTVSLFIPLYNFYRPWAGLGEVINTLRSALATRAVPLKGIRGANAFTVTLALASYSFLIFQKIIGKSAEATGASKVADQTSALRLLGELSNLFLVDALVTLVYVALLYAYWSTILRLFKEALRLPVAFPEPETSPPARDILNVQSPA